MTDSPPENLTGKLLIAMPGMSDPRFEKSVIFLVEHSAKGAMGLIVNKPTPDVKPEELLEQLGIETGPGFHGLKVHFGGPVEHGRGFVLHSRDYDRNTSTLPVTETVGMTATLDILQDIAAGDGPDRAFLALGYSGWGPGQLETELQANGWLTADAPPEIVFDPDAGGKWVAALKTLGIDVHTLSSAAGHA
ncbi:YqgE/AlgH family protein [Ovoidimarina sediminis]|uniref:YqgE/AlgH family protein n=1 Tax=Ovoidimarina sediminis TaxID=3079856 RepID=UPI00290B2CC7|nr:YqgE/AlgH family protein [Rhodophyticola sp. MJ-SS7]MDU8943508.1 YqgE/AlgH family protein [Rhodophyticola sp. MJ-SS7]